MAVPSPVFKLIFRNRLEKNAEYCHFKSSDLNRKEGYGSMDSITGNKFELPRLQLSYAGHYLFVDNFTRTMHCHRGGELVLFRRGACRTRFESGEDLSCTASQVLVTPPGLPHLQYDNTTDCETYYLVLEGAFEPQEFSLRMISPGDDTIVPEWFRQIFELCEQHESESASVLLSLLWRRLLEIENRSEERRSFHPALLKAVDWIRHHYREDLSVCGIAESCAVSVSLLNLLFRRQFGVGPRRYLLSLRMREARRLLLDNRYRIGEVAELTGFQSANYFSRSFKSYHGVTPEEYRNGPPEFADQVVFLE